MPLLVVQQAAAAFLGDQRVPPEHLVLLRVEGQQRAAAEAALRVVPGEPGRVGRLIDRRPRQMRRHVEDAVRHRGGEAVVDLALRRPAGVARVIHHLVQREEVIQRILLFVVADDLDHAAGDALGAGRGVDPPVGPDRHRPAGVGVRMSGERIPTGPVSRLAGAPDGSSRWPEPRPPCGQRQPGSGRARAALEEFASFHSHSHDRDQARPVRAIAVPAQGGLTSAEFSSRCAPGSAVLHEHAG